MFQDSWDRFYEEYRQYLEAVGIRLSVSLEGSETDVETDDESIEQVDDSGWVIATPEGSEWGDDEIDNLPSLDEFLK
jgi:hypothetical protein